MNHRGHCLMPRAKNARGKVRGALPRTPARGTPPETPGRLSLPLHLAERSSLSRVRSAALTSRALDSSGPFRRVCIEKGKAAIANALLRPSSASRWSDQTQFQITAERRLGRRSLRSAVQAHSSIRKCSPAIPSQEFPRHTVRLGRPWADLETGYTLRDC